VTASIGQRLVAEAVGTFALVFAGCGAIMVDAKTGQLGHVGVAISFGLVITVMISALGHISGAHFNPAVTFAFALGRHFPAALVLPYWAAQLVGAVAAALLLRGSLGLIGGLGATTPSGSDGQAFLWETVLTVFLVLVILAVATDTRAQGQLAAIAIGATVGLDAMFGGPITGASMNPARSLGPAIAGGPTTGLWIYLVAPLVGAAISTGVYAYLSVRRPAVA
jgi:MIP family channel proteins